MPTVTVKDTTLYAYCLDGRCAGYKEEPVQGVAQETSLTYLELGGDMPGFERSNERYLVLGDDGEPVELPCPHCGKPRDLSPNPRPEYPRNSGQDPMLLLQLGQQEGRLRDLEHAAQLKSVQESAELAELRAQVAEMRALLTDQAKPARRAKADLGAV